MQQKTPSFSEVSFGFLFALSFVLIARMIASMSAYVNDMFPIQISSQSDEQSIKLFLENDNSSSSTSPGKSFDHVSPMFYASQFYHPMPNSHAHQVLGNYGYILQYHVVGTQQPRYFVRDDKFHIAMLEQTGFWLRVYHE